MAENGNAGNDPEIHNASSRKELIMPKGFQMPSQSTQESGHGWAPIAMTDNEQIDSVAMPPESETGYGSATYGAEAPAPQSELAHQDAKDGYGSTLH
jgi:hypothetical protein